MRTLWQSLLLAAAVVALLALIAEIGLAIAATIHGNHPARVVRISAGPYPLTVSLYKEPTDAGFALPLTITSTEGPLDYEVTSQPAKNVDATPVRATVARDASQPNSVQGNAEIPVQGDWTLHIVVKGPAGEGTADIPLHAVAPPAIPVWSGWLVGFISLYGLLAFLFAWRGPRHKAQAGATDRAYPV